MRERKGTPKLKNGFVRIANELYDAIMCAPFTKRQRKIIDLIIRCSYGCKNKIWARLILRDFTATGIHEPHVRKTVDSLLGTNVIIHNPKLGYRLNKFYREWKLTKTVSIDTDRLTKTVSKNLLKQSIKTNQNSKFELAETVRLNGKSINGDRDLSPPKYISNTTRYNKEIAYVISFLNKELKTNFSPLTESTKRFIAGRLGEGRMVNDFKKVILWKKKEWIGTEWEKYLRPSTLFRPTNFENYFNEALMQERRGEESEEVA